MGLLTKDQLTTKRPVRIERVDVPELGEDAHVFVKGMTTSERARFERQFVTSSGQPNERNSIQYRERLLVACVCDADGNSILDLGDVTALAEQSADIVDRIATACQDVVGIKKRDAEKLAGNSDTTTPDD